MSSVSTAMDVNCTLDTAMLNVFHASTSTPSEHHPACSSRTLRPYRAAIPRQLDNSSSLQTLHSLPFAADASVMHACNGCGISIGAIASLPSDPHPACLSRILCPDRAAHHHIAASTPWFHTSPSIVGHTGPMLSTDILDAWRDLPYLADGLHSPMESLPPLFGFFHLSRDPLPKHSIPADAPGAFHSPTVTPNKLMHHHQSQQRN